MLDNTIKLFDVNVGALSQKESDNRISFSSCRATIYNYFNEEKSYSEIDEESFLPLNDNNGHGYIDFEFAFNENLKNPYMEFYASCFAFRSIEPKATIKLNGQHMTDKSIFREAFKTKVNKDGKLSCGIRYYFNNEREKQLFLNCKELCLEGRLALGKKRNVYGIVVRLKKENNEWMVLDANTYKDKGFNTIYGYVH